MKNTADPICVDLGGPVESIRLATGRGLPTDDEGELNYTLITLTVEGYEIPIRIYEPVTYSSSVRVVSIRAAHVATRPDQTSPYEADVARRGNISIYLMK